MPEKVILFLAANPKDTARLRLDEELREIRRNLRGASLRDQFRLVDVTSARQKDIRQALLDHKPYAVHFSGHGTKDAEIIIANDDGSAHYVGAEALVPFFEIFSDHVECVVLSSCFTEPLAEKIGRHVDYVVGMKDALEDKPAIQYAAGFYDALFADRTVELAHKLGCNAIRWPELPGHLVPVLYVAKGHEKGIKPMSDKQYTPSIKPIHMTSNDEIYSRASALVSRAERRVWATALSPGPWNGTQGYIEAVAQRAGEKEKECKHFDHTVICGPDLSSHEENRIRVIEKNGAADSLTIKRMRHHWPIDFLIIDDKHLHISFQSRNRGLFTGLEIENDPTIVSQIADWFSGLALRLETIYPRD